MTRRLLLVAGGCSDIWAYDRYANDLGLFYDAAVRSSGYAPEDVRVCFKDGNAPVPNVPASIRTAARRADLDGAFLWLSDLGEGDRAVVVVSNHGDGEGLWLWGKDKYYMPDHVQRALAGCVATKVFVLGQCHAGRFAKMSMTNVVLACAAASHEASNSFDLQYDEFLYQFASALRGGYPDGRPLRATVPQPGAITIDEAFRYAAAFDRCSAKDWPLPLGYPADKYAPETPELHENPAGLAVRITL